MKRFFEDYGKVMVIAIIILALLALVPRIGAKVEERVLSTNDALSENSESNILTFLGSPESNDSKVQIVGTVAKGNIVTIDGKEYRVLSINGNEAKMLAMYFVDTTYALNLSYTSFNGVEGLQYADSTFDDYLENEFYSSLSFADAIIPQNITQNMYQFNGATADILTWYKSDFTSTTTKEEENVETYTLSKIGSVLVGARHVYVLDIQDIIDYLGSNITPQQLNTIFWNLDASINGIVPIEHFDVILRSAFTGPQLDGYFHDYVSKVEGVYGKFGFEMANFSGHLARPAFVLDLTKCNYTN